MIFIQTHLLLWDFNPLGSGCRILKNFKSLII